MTAAPLLRLQRLTIEQLFGPGSSDIDIPFKLGQRVTVLHGRNGSGKTITLGLLDALRAGRLEEFLRYPFKKFRLELSDGTSLTLERTTSGQPEQEPKPDDVALRYTIRAADGVVREERPLADLKPLRRTGASLREAILAALPWLSPMGSDAWFDHDEEEPLSTEEVLEQYSKRLRFARELIHASRDDSHLSRLLDRLPPVKFIKAHRLFVRELDTGPFGRLRHERHTRLMVERLSQDIRARVVQADREYRLISTRLDSSLATRVFEHRTDIPSLEALRERSKKLREQEARLNRLGLLGEGRDPLNEAVLTEDQRRTFFIILKDREEKLAPFASVVAKAQRLLDSLNRKLAPKSVRLDVDTGYQILTAAGTPLSLEQLSSGEQHELVLMHELLFDVQPGSLILIDEPELSLHVTWQVDVLPELLEIAKLADLDFVLATHSPYITRDHEELMVRLGEPV